MRPIRLAILGAALVALVLPADLAAQGQGKGKAKGKNKDKNETEQVDRQRSDRPGRDNARSARGRADRRVETDRDERVVLRDGDRVVVRDRGRVIVRDRDRDGDVVIRGRDSDRRFRANDRAGAPAFCRSGAGHPVHGRRWCLDKGFGLGDRDDVFFEGDDEVIFWDGDEVVVVRDSRLDRDRSIWERISDTVLFWRD